MEELDWSAESQVLIPAEHLWCDFKCRPWAQNSLNTNDLYIHYMDKSTGTPPSLEEKRALPNRGNKDGNTIHVLTIFISTSVATVFKSMKWLYPHVPIRHWCLVMNYQQSKKSFTSLFVDERFINKVQFDAGFAHRLILKDGAVPAIKDPGHDSELQTVSETASNVSVLFAIAASARHSLAPPTVHLQDLSFFRRES